MFWKNKIEVDQLICNRKLNGIKESFFEKVQDGENYKLVELHFVSVVYIAGEKTYIQSSNLYYIKLNQDCILHIKE